MMRDCENVFSWCAQDGAGLPLCRTPGVPVLADPHLRKNNSLISETILRRLVLVPRQCVRISQRLLASSLAKGTGPEPATSGIRRIRTRPNPFDERITFSMQPPDLSPYPPASPSHDRVTFWGTTWSFFVIGPAQSSLASVRRMGPRLRPCAGLFCASIFAGGAADPDSGSRTLIASLCGGKP